MKTMMECTFAGVVGRLVPASGPVSSVLNASKRFDPNQQALVALAKEAARVGASRRQAAILKEWAKAYNMRWAGPEAHQGRGFGANLHIRIGQSIRFLSTESGVSSGNMKYFSYSFLEEPSGDSYEQLVAWLSHRCTSFLLVVREGDSLDRSGQVLLEKLRRLGAIPRAVSKWPGTELVDEVAVVWSCHLSSEAIDQLTSSVVGLYEWQQPSWPEDLCFLREDGTAALISITHERDAYLCISETEAREFGILVGLGLKRDTENACVE